MNVKGLNLMLSDMPYTCIFLTGALEIHDAWFVGFTGNYVAAVWYWIQEFNPKHLSKQKEEEQNSCIHHRQMKLKYIGSAEAWLWIATTEPIHHRILGVYISRHRACQQQKNHSLDLVKLYETYNIFRHTVVLGIRKHASLWD